MNIIYLFIYIGHRTISLDIWWTRLFLKHGCEEQVSYSVSNLHVIHWKPAKQIRCIPGSRPDVWNHYIERQTPHLHQSHQTPNPRGVCTASPVWRRGILLIYRSAGIILNSAPTHNKSVFNTIKPFFLMKPVERKPQKHFSKINYSNTRHMVL